MEETLSISGTVETVVYANEQTGYAVLELSLIHISKISAAR